ncbi:MAG: HAD family hydrolase [Oligoflexia bacterium]|nr:HAD family hydrolase [Oligoflexia bacterium]
MKKKACLFLDRDGVIIKDVGYIKSVEQIELYDDIIPIIKWAKSKEKGRERDQDYYVVVVSNQAGVAKGYCSEEDVLLINSKIDEMLKAKGAYIDKWYYCPFHPTEGVGQYKRESEWRKPKPGMFLQACKDFAIDLNKSIMIGDKKSDIPEFSELSEFSEFSEFADVTLRSFLIQQNYSLEGVDKNIIFANHQLLLQYLNSME